MKKSSFFKIITIATITAIIPVMSMDNPLEIAKKPTFIFTLPASHKYVDKPIQEAFEKQNKATCKILLINHSENTKWFDIKYEKVQFQTSADDTKKILTSGSLAVDNFTDNQQDIQNTAVSFSENFKKNVPFLFPSQLPEIFLQELEKKTSITHELEKCTVIFKLDENQSATKKQQDSTKVQSTPTSQSNTKKYLLFGGLGIGIAGFIAWLVYLQQNNRLDLSQITNFIHSFTKK